MLNCSLHEETPSAAAIYYYFKLYFSGYSCSLNCEISFLNLVCTVSRPVLYLCNMTEETEKSQWIYNSCRNILSYNYFICHVLVLTNIPSELLF